MYVIHKCGIKINTDELDINQCPVCEDILEKQKREPVNAERRKVWRESQRKHRKKEITFHYFEKFLV